MKLKYYLRGLGLGILVSTLILSAGLRGRTEMTDDEIRARARSLGMTEENEVLSAQAERLASGEEKDGNPVHEKTVSGERTEASGKTVSEASEKSAGQDSGNGGGGSKEAMKPVEAEAPSAKTSPDTKPDPETKKKEDLSAGQGEQTAVPSGEKSNEQETAEEEIPKPAMVIRIEKGESSTSVAKKVQEAGLVTDAAQLDSYLCLNGYDRKLVVGDHKIPQDAELQDIARILISKAD